MTRTFPLLLLAAALAACSSASPRPPTAPAAASAPAAQPAPPTTPQSAPQAPVAPAAPPATPDAAEPTMPAAEAPAVADENSIFFASAATQLDAAGQAKLHRHAARLKDNPQLTVTLVGHTDNLGSTSYNLAIAEQRAATVARALQAMGVGRGQIRHYGLGDEKAGPACKTAGCRQKRRRVDLVYPD